MTDRQTPQKTGSQPVYRIADYTDSKRQKPPPPPDDYASGVRDRVRQRRVSKRNTIADWVWVIVAGALFSIVVVLSIGAFLLVQSYQDSMDVVPTIDVRALLPTPETALADAAIIHDEVLVLDDGQRIELIAWDGQSRFTMLVAGLDRRPDEDGFAYRTDTMMLVSLDPATRRLGILSIPRDLYVQVPGYSDLQRINTALFLGESQGTDMGIPLMMQTVQLNFGIRVNEYVIADFQAFVDLVDAVGGINILTTYAINDPTHPDLTYGYDPFYLPAGQHHLNGYDTLRFARTRYGNSDVQRAERQQQVIFALRDRILNLGLAPSLIRRAPSLWQSWDDNVYTGLTLEQMLQLGLYVRDIPRENIYTGVINYDYSQTYTTPSGAEVLIPDRARLGELMVSVFGADYSQ